MIKLVKLSPSRLDVQPKGGYFCILEVKSGLESSCPAIPIAGIFYYCIRIISWPFLAKPYVLWARFDVCMLKFLWISLIDLVLSRSGLDYCWLQLKSVCCIFLCWKSEVGFTVIFCKYFMFNWLVYYKGSMQLLTHISFVGLGVILHLLKGKLGVKKSRKW